MMSAVGDVVHTLPVVTAIKRAHPRAHITWVLQPGPAALVRGHPAIDEIVLFDRRHGWRALLEVRRALRGRPFDVVLAMQDYLKAGLVTALPSAPVKLGYDRARARDANWIFTNRRLPPHAPRHIQDEYLEFADAIGVPTAPLTWDIGPWPEERGWQREFVARFDRPIAALVIGSSRAEKDWIPERWAALAQALHDAYGLAPVLVGARTPREEATEREVVRRAGAVVTSALDSGLRPLVGILDAAALVVSIDTGPLHIAVALQRPVVSLLGATNPLRYGPYRRFEDLVVSAYGNARSGEALATDRRPGRMQTITVEQVLEKVQRWRERYAR